MNLKNKKEINVSDLICQSKDLKIGEIVFLTGKIYTARDAAHKRIYDLILNGKQLPIDLKNAVIYYTGPTPTPPGMIIGSCGPTTAYRMDRYVEPLLKLGIAGMIGKGKRSSQVMDLISKYQAIYFSAIGGAGALACKFVKRMREVAFQDLGCESIKELYIDSFPLIVSGM